MKIDFWHSRNARSLLLPGTTIGLMFILALTTSSAPPAQPNEKQIGFITTKNVSVAGTIPAVSVANRVIEAREIARIAALEQRTAILRSYLEGYGSPLAEHAQAFVSSGDEYGVDWRIIVAISGKEQTFGVASPGSSNNFWGYGGHRWSDIDTAINDYTWHMSVDYPALCQGNVYAAASYAESETWEAGVSEFYNELCGRCER